MNAKNTAIPETVPVGTLPADTPSYDVVVVGFGIAGGCAALEAARAGARVLLLEKAAVHGGTSAMSGGHFYLGAGTAVQQATGHEDSVEDMYNYLVAASKEPEKDKIRVYCEESVAHFDWLEALGFEFERSYYPREGGHPARHPGPDVHRQREGVALQGGRPARAARPQGAGARRHRGHQARDGPAARPLRGGRRRGALRDRRDPARRLRATGAVVGVAWKSFEQTGVVLAPAVVLAAGGFVMNPDMVAEHTPALAEKPFTLGSTYDDGLGIRLGASVGAELKHMDEPFITAPFYPPSKLMFGFLVNKDGVRFCGEDGYHSRTSQFVMEQRDHAAYLIVDSEHVEYPVFPLVPLIDGYETIEELETGLGAAGRVGAEVARALQRARRGQGRPRLPQVARLARAAGASARGPPST